MVRRPRSAARTLRALLLAVVATACAPLRAGEPPAGTLDAVVRDTEGRPVADAVIVATPVDLTGLPAARRRAEHLDQVDQEFVPTGKGVLVGSTVAFPNKDDVRHHVYSFSPAKRFELPLYAGMPTQPVVFDKAGVVVLGCNIHDWMVGWVYVSDSPWFAKTGAEGRATLVDVPARRVVVRAWHPQLDGTEASTRRTIDIVAGQRIEVEWTLTLKPDVRVRRAPAASRGGRY